MNSDNTPDWVKLTPEVIDRFCGKDFYLEVTKYIGGPVEWLQIVHRDYVGEYDAIEVYAPNDVLDAEVVIDGIDVLEPMTLRYLTSFYWNGNLFTENEIIEMCEEFGADPDIDGEEES